MTSASFDRVAVTTVDPDTAVDLAARSLSASPRAFLRWAGSKQRVLGQLLPYLPRRFRTYYEPFLGAGALFFLVRPKRARLGDACEDLIATYEAIRDDHELVLRYLRPLDVLDSEVFYAVRRNRSTAYFKGAAEFLYLNRAGWNGLYRVNSSGHFNVPYGWPRSEILIDEDNLAACARVLRRSGVRLASADFEDTLAEAGHGDLVFLDPPYVTGHNNNGFVDYNESLFSWADQERLAEVAHALVRRGAHVVVTNAHHDAVLGLYRDFDIAPLTRSSTLAGDTTARKPVTEAILWSAPKRWRVD